VSALVTVGHGSLAQEELVRLLGGARIATLVDVRRFPGSRRHPHLSRAALDARLPEAGIAYRWESRLGGRRRARPDSPHVALRDPGFRGYADHMETADFREAVAELLDEAAGRPTAVMCSEAVWWRCHRRLVADHVALVHGAAVRHLMHDGRLVPHAVTEVARDGGGRVVYDRASP
jgi:uncharacterized protein (DUF488 family)